MKKSENIQMAEPTLQQVFGANATQDANTITISKADLASIGLTASANNTAESLFAAIIAKAQQQLTSTNQTENIEQSVVIEDGFQSLVTRNNATYRQVTKTITFEKPDNSGTFDPDDY
ncbi:hypothetical protein NIES4106_53560 [Fischerella sp. NIES-4106]|nr:hypothetical protein NIES4106_10270 [Fischerella sp. NIES-4106]BAZ70561.1 hypothetical protein NIES4106_53560 [Fischerella sp. NIES-4106]